MIGNVGLFSSVDPSVRSRSSKEAETKHWLVGGSVSSASVVPPNHTLDLFEILHRAIKLFLPFVKERV